MGLATSEEFPNAHKFMGCKMLLFFFILGLHCFSTNLGALCDENGERFRQEIFTKEKRHQRSED
jgi:hypothetical protein